ncbi:hypothetical protein BC826DRAFT_1109962 [Russula brevipes]|nr:hypothetical protein BC826DRAFT_1109962 [Russula brevipes]
MTSHNNLVSPLFDIIGRWLFPGPEAQDPHTPSCTGSVTTPDKSDVGSVTIDVLPDDVLLDMFGFYVDGTGGVEAWQLLVHVCQRWRNLVFASPRRLDLRLVCTDRRRVRELLGIWPPLPIEMRSSESTRRDDNDPYNVIAALEHRDRVCRVSISDVHASLLDEITARMQLPFRIYLSGASVPQ